MSNSFFIEDIPVDTGRILNVHKTFRRRPGHLLNVLCTFGLRPVSTGILMIKYDISVIIWVIIFCLQFSCDIQRYRKDIAHDLVDRENLANRKQCFDYVIKIIYTKLLKLRQINPTPKANFKIVFVIELLSNGFNDINIQNIRTSIHIRIFSSSCVVSKLLGIFSTDENIPVLTVEQH